MGGCHRKYAFGHDEVAPISKQPLDPLNGWGASIIDAMSTMVRDIMSLDRMRVSELINGTSTLWDSQYDGCHSPIFSPLNRLSRISSMNPSTSRKVLTSRKRKPPTLSGNSAAQLTVLRANVVLQPLRNHDSLRRRTHQRIRA